MKNNKEPAMRWRQVSAIYQNYQANKGPWRRFFKVDSALMNTLKNVLAKADVNSRLTPTDKLQLMQHLYKTLPNNSQKLSYQSAQRLVGLCLGSHNTGLFQIVKQLYSLDILNEKILQLFQKCEHKAFIAQQFDLIIKHSNFSANPQQLKNTLITNLSQSNTAECLAGLLWEHLLDWQAAVACYEKLLSTQQHAQVLYYLGRLYNQDRSKNGTIIIKHDKQKSLSFYKKATLLGSQEALKELQNEAASNKDMAFYLGDIYAKGLSSHIVKDLKEALTWYKRASDRGHADASFYLGQYLEKVARPRLDHVYHYYARAAQQGHTEAHHYLMEQANSGIAEAQYALGYHYYLPKKHVIQSFHWCSQAANQQHPLALAYINKTQFDAGFFLALAKAYETGLELPQQLDTAITFYQKAAQQDNLEAILYLAKLYEAGQHGFQENLLQALAYYQQAVNLGFSPVILCQIGEKFEQGISVPIDKLKAIECYELAATKNYLPALLRLIDFYMASNQEKTFNYCKQALFLGCQLVLPTLQRLAKDGNGNAQDELSAIYRKLGRQAQAGFWKKPISMTSPKITEVPIQAMSIRALTP